MRRIAPLLGCGVLLLALVIWAPWLTSEWAGERAAERFTAAWDGVVDGCGFDCSGCGVIDSQRVGFGCNVEIEYACGLIPEDAPQNHQVDQVFVSVLGTVIGLVKP